MDGKFCIRLCNRPITVSSFPWHSMYQGPSIKHVVMDFWDRFFHYFIIAWRTLLACSMIVIANWGSSTSRNMCLALNNMTGYVLSSCFPPSSSIPWVSTGFECLRVPMVIWAISNKCNCVEKVRSEKPDQSVCKGWNRLWSPERQLF